MKETVIDIIDSNFIMFRTRKFKSDMEYISCLGRVSGEIMKVFKEQLSDLEEKLKDREAEVASLKARLNHEQQLVAIYSTNLKKEIT